DHVDLADVAIRQHRPSDPIGHEDPLAVPQGSGSLSSVRFTGGCPSGQRERSVKSPAMPTEVRILLLPLRVFSKLRPLTSQNSTERGIDRCSARGSHRSMPMTP